MAPMRGIKVATTAVLDRNAERMPEISMRAIITERSLLAHLAFMMGRPIIITAPVSNIAWPTIIMPISMRTRLEDQPA